MHAFPAKDKIFREGDIVSFDLGMWYKGLATDMALTVGVGKITPQHRALLNATQEALDQAIHSARALKHMGDISQAIEQTITQAGFGVVKELGGHGVGESVHEDPMLPNYGHQGEGEELVFGFVFAIEPMATTGSGEVKELSDGWTWVTKDGSVAAHFEHTVAITEKGAEILTKL